MRYKHTSDDGAEYETLALEVLWNGLRVGWVSPDDWLAWERGALSDQELVHIARRNPHPPMHGRLVLWDRCGPVQFLDEEA
jgi:hypothetical protein